MTPTYGRVAHWWHLVTAALCGVVLLAQFLLTLFNPQVLPGIDPVPTWLRVIRLFSFFTIQSNLLVLLSTIPLARRVDHDGTLWRVLRLAGLAGITVTGLVHWFLLRDPNAVHDVHWVVDRGLHLVIPIMAVLGWLLFGPRPRVGFATIRGALAWPLVWLFGTFVVAGISGWVPYPFLDVRTSGVGGVVITLIGITVLYLGLELLILLGDRRLPTGRPRADQSKIGPTVRDRLSSKKPG